VARRLRCSNSVEPRRDLADGARDDEAALLEDADRCADVGELREDVGREEDRLSKPAELQEQIADLDPRAWIKVARGLVKDEHLRVVEEDPAELKALLHALRHRGDDAVLDLAEVGELEDGVDHLERRHAVGVGEELEVLAHRDSLVDARVIRHVPDALAH
jgi:hypothetical protein